jgi:hypothetical protein
MLGCPSCRVAVTVEAFVGQGSLAARDGCQEGPDLGGAFPGDDAFGPVCLAEDLDEPGCGCGIGRIGQQQGGDVVPECAAAQMLRRQNSPSRQWRMPAHGAYRRPPSRAGGPGSSR